MRLNISHFKIIDNGETTLTLSDVSKSKINSTRPLYLSPYDTEGDLIYPELRKSKELMRILYLLESNGYAFCVDRRENDPTKADVFLLKGQVIDLNGDKRRTFTVGL